MKDIDLVYFSPTGNTRKTLQTIAAGAQTQVIEHDRTYPQSRKEKLHFTKDSFVILGCPVYAGRIPSKPENIFEGIEGDDTPVVLVVTYGNREYDDALLELKNLAIENGFIPVAAAAFLAVHSYSDKLASGRPDENDLEIMGNFGRTIREKYLRKNDYKGTLIVKGNYPYKDGMSYTPLAPEVSEDCTECGECVSVCPVAAINPDDPTKTNPDLCIRCCACVRICPVEARKFTAQPFLATVQFLESNFAGIYKKPEIFYITED